MTTSNWQTDNTLCELSQLGLLALSGDDAITFLQGQVTNDVNQLDGKLVHYSAYCSPKGRMLALFLAFKHQDKTYLQFSQPLLESVMKRLKMYVMRAKVDIADVSDELRRFGIGGPDAKDIVTKALGVAPEQDYAMVETANGLIIQMPSIEGHQRYEVIVNAEQAENLLNTLKESSTLVDTTCWDWLDIQTGCPDVLAKTQEQFVPQMLNLDVLNGVNFKKGCYTGQEIVARTHYLGKVKRRTYLASIETTEQPTEGDKVIDAAGSEVGQMVKTARNLTGGFDALIEIRIEAKQAGNIMWKTYPVTFGTLPYSLNDESEPS
ncbi:MAG: folate-binding protein YgfZ [Methylophilaceae bacterium]|nr:MAG: folate-binding protein YgfZ [Methylophilaceae bacterium]